VSNFRISKYYVIFVYFQASVLALNVKKNQNKDYVIFGNSTPIKVIQLKEIKYEIWIINIRKLSVIFQMHVSYNERTQVCSGLSNASLCI
jgi:thiamine pyrophosphokinase